jgi:hypothetical protein
MVLRGEADQMRLRPRSATVSSADNEAAGWRNLHDLRCAANDLKHQSASKDRARLAGAGQPGRIAPAAIGQAPTRSRRVNSVQLHWPKSTRSRGTMHCLATAIAHSVAAIDHRVLRDRLAEPVVGKHEPGSSEGP